MSETTICPWCDTEIVWDEEFGPEAICPHCENELTEYRSLRVADAGDKGVEIDPEEEVLTLLETDSEIETFEDDSYAAYEDQVQLYLERQDERIHCMNCGEEMICTGTHTVGKDDFEPVVPQAPKRSGMRGSSGKKSGSVGRLSSAGQSEPGTPESIRILDGPFLKPPFTVNVYVCPACFQVKSILCEEDRMKLIASHQKRTD